MACSSTIDDEEIYNCQVPLLLLPKKRGQVHSILSPILLTIANKLLEVENSLEGGKGRADSQDSHPDGRIAPRVLHQTPINLESIQNMLSNLISKLTQFAKRRNPDFTWKQVWLQWGLGMYFATPMIALVQGSLLLNNYRVRYADAPRPIMPARGVAIAVEEEQVTSSYLWRLRHPFSSSSSLPSSDQPPVRLLVIGDSLAAGVGVSKSGVPILPESVARALSKALHGRPVYWTCVGTPGVSASQIVKDIHETEPYDPNPKSRQLERIVKEFQVRRRRWVERRRQEEIRGNLETVSVGDKATVSSTTDEVMEDGSEARKKNYFLEWWKQIRENEDRFKTPREIRETTRKVTMEWWRQVRNTFQKRQERVKEDISVIKEIVLEPLPKLDDTDDDYYYDYYRDNRLEDDSSDTSGRKGVPLIRKGSIFRRSSVNPEAAAQYDIAIVLTGLNDVKEAFMPHMMSRKGRGDSTDGQGEERKLQTELYRVLEALQAKMGKMDLERNRTNQKNPREMSPIKRPLVVVPELPVAPLQLFQLVPLCWFLVPIFRAMENNKRFLASCFPEYVVFVEQPELRWWTDTETGIGPVRENIRQEQLLLRVTDIGRTAREQIQEGMKQYYREDNKSSSVEDITANECVIENDSKIRMIDDHDHLHYDVDRNEEDQQRLGKNLVSVDQIHPNDEGYELWGRHIAAAIIGHWDDVER